MSVNTFNFSANDPTAGSLKKTSSNNQHESYSSDEEKESLLLSYRMAKHSFDKAVLNAGKQGINAKTTNAGRKTALYLQHAIRTLQQRLPEHVTDSMKRDLEELDSINVNIHPIGGKSRRVRGRRCGCKTRQCRCRYRITGRRTTRRGRRGH